MQPTPAELKQRVSIVELISRDQPLVKCGGHEWKGVNHDSLRVNDEKNVWGWFSNKYTSTTGGDIYTWLIEMHGMNFHEAFLEVMREAGLTDLGEDVRGRRVFIPPPRPPDPVPLAPINPKIVEDCKATLESSDAARVYLATRCMSVDDALAHDLGWMDNMTGVGPIVVIPVYDENSKLVTIRYRAVDSSIAMMKYGYMFRGYGAHLYMGWNISEPCDTIAICEGEFKAIHMNRAGIRTVGLMGASSMKTEWLPRFANAKTVYLMLDPDQQPGEIGWCCRLASMHPRVRVVSLPSKPDDMIISGNGPGIIQAMQWATPVVPSKRNIVTNADFTYKNPIAARAPAARSTF